jgi:hypothetical protein
MAGLTFLIALIALIVAVLAHRRTAGPKDWESQLEGVRERTADALSKLEKSLRKEGKEGGEKDEGTAAGPSDA